MATAVVHQAPSDILRQVHKPLAQGTKPAKHDVYAEVNYYKDPGDGTLPSPSFVGKPNTFVRPPDAQNVIIHDISGDEDKYTLDSHGFQFVKHESQENDFLDDKKIKTDYYTETEQLLKNITGASRIEIFDYTLRRLPSDVRDVAGKLRGPARRVHIDQSYRGAASRLKHHLPGEADELLKKRFQIINVWRPIKIILRDPLTLADAQSVPERDLLPASLIYPDREGETFVVKANPDHRWYFKHAQRPDEPLLIKCFDSLDDGRARRTPHTAFVSPGQENQPPRESIEVRALVFYDYSISNE